MTLKSKRVAVVGGGPAGLMAAERLVGAGAAVTIFERMPSPARKFLLAGRGGLNLSHSEDLEKFLTRYDMPDQRLIEAVRAFPPASVIAWASSLGIATFTGSSGRMFPTAMKASPLLRAWLRRLDSAGVVIKTRTRWTGFRADGALEFTDESTGTAFHESFDATVLALGGASWPRLGSDGVWTSILAAAGIAVTPLAPANAGITLAWSPHIKERFAGKPLKRLSITVGDHRRRGEAVITHDGLEGGVIYALSEPLRSGFAASAATLSIDLRPDLDAATLTTRLAAASKKQSLANTLRKSAGLDAAHIALLHEGVSETHPLPRDASALAARIKSVNLTATGFAGMSRAISTAGGLSFAELDERFMLSRRPGIFIAGEMLDWTAPTGGYLLQASFATAAAAASGVQAWLKSAENPA